MSLPPRQPQVLGNGRYALTARLGEGGMAGVYRAFDQQMKIERAVKVMLPRPARSRKLRKRFEREAHTLARLEHANLVRVFDVANQHGVPFLVMELIDGGTLADWVERHGAMPPQMAVEVVLQLCEGVIAAHDAGVVHRDIKPHNVLIARTGTCKLADFGIAHVDEDGLTRTGSTMGTMGYMPPEQRKDAKSVDARCDVFSIGATLWFLLKNEPVVDLFLAADRPDLLDGIPKALHLPLVTALAYNRNDRHPDVRALRDELLGALERLPPDGPRPSLVPARAAAPELIGDWFEELAPLFDNDSAVTPEPVDLRDTGPSWDDVSEPGPPPQAAPPPESPAPAPSSPPEELEPEEESGIVIPPAAVAGAASLLAGLLVLGVFAVGMMNSKVALDQSHAVVSQQEASYFALLDQQVTVVNDLIALGVPRESLDAPFFAFQDAQDPEARRARAEELVDALEKASDSLGTGHSVQADRVRAQVSQLVQARERVRDAEAAYETSARTIRGRILTLLGAVE